MLSDKEIYELAEAYLVKGEAIFDNELFSKEVSDKIVQLANEMKQHEAEIAIDVAQEETVEGPLAEANEPAVEA